MWAPVAFVRGLGSPELVDLREIPGKDTPTLIASWIRSSCDWRKANLKPAGSVEGPRRALQIHGHGPHAQKLRSSASHFFSIDQGRGSRPFMESEDGSWSGNLLSDFVAQYVKSLKRRKVRYRLHAVSNECLFNGFLFSRHGWRDQTLLVENILTAQAKKKYAAELRGFHFPPGWGRLQSPIHHLKI